MPPRKHGGPSPATVTDELLVQVLDVQRELVTEIRGLRRDLTSTRPAVPPVGRVDACEPVRPPNVIRIPRAVTLTEPARPATASGT